MLSREQMTAHDARGWGCLLALVIGAGLGFLAVQATKCLSGCAPRDVPSYDVTVTGRDAAPDRGDP